MNDSRKKKNKEEFRILSLDGGGIRGIIEAQVLQNFETEIKTPLYSFFDLIAGTSTGGILTCLIGGKKLSANACVEIYDHKNALKMMNGSFWDRILPIENEPKYDGVGKREALNEFLGDKRILDVGDAAKILVTAYDLITRKIVTFKSYGGSDSTYNPTLAEVADASSAAPIYFPTLKSSDDPPRWLVDGGIAANNPGMCAITEALKMGHHINSIKMLSLGTGFASRNHDSEAIGEESKHWGAFGWIKNGLMEHLFAGNSSAVENYCKQALGDNFLRINGPLVYASSKMDDVDADNIDNLRRTGKEWYLNARDDLMELFELRT